MLINKIKLFFIILFCNYNCYKYSENFDKSPSKIQQIQPQVILNDKTNHTSPNNSKIIQPITQKSNSNPGKKQDVFLSVSMGQNNRKTEKVIPIIIYVVEISAGGYIIKEAFSVKNEAPVLQASAQEFKETLEKNQEDIIKITKEKEIQDMEKKQENELKKITTPTMTKEDLKNKIINKEIYIDNLPEIINGEYLITDQNKNITFSNTKPTTQKDEYKETIIDKKTVEETLQLPMTVTEKIIIETPQVNKETIKEIEEKIVDYNVSIETEAGSNQYKIKAKQFNEDQKDNQKNFIKELKEKNTQNNNELINKLKKQQHEEQIKNEQKQKHSINNEEKQNLLDELNTLKINFDLEIITNDPNINKFSSFFQYIQDKFDVNYINQKQMSIFMEYNLSSNGNVTNESLFFKQIIMPLIENYLIDQNQVYCKDIEFSKLKSMYAFFYLHANNKIKKNDFDFSNIVEDFLYPMLLKIMDYEESNENKNNLIVNNKNYVLLYAIKLYFTDPDNFKKLQDYKTEQEEYKTNTQLKMNRIIENIENKFNSLDSKNDTNIINLKNILIKDIKRKFLNQWMIIEDIYYIKEDENNLSMFEKEINNIIKEDDINNILFNCKIIIVRILRDRKDNKLNNIYYNKITEKITEAHEIYNKFYVSQNEPSKSKDLTLTTKYLNLINEIFELIEKKQSYNDVINEFDNDKKKIIENFISESCYIHHSFIDNNKAYFSEDDANNDILTWNKVDSLFCFYEESRFICENLMEKYNSLDNIVENDQKIKEKIIFINNFNYLIQLQNEINELIKNHNPNKVNPYKYDKDIDDSSKIYKNKKEFIFIVAKIMNLFYETQRLLEIYNFSDVYAFYNYDIDHASTYHGDMTRVKNSMGYSLTNLEEYGNFQSLLSFNDYTDKHLKELINEMSSYDFELKNHYNTEDYEHLTNKPKYSNSLDNPLYLINKFFKHKESLLLKSNYLKSVYNNTETDSMKFIDTLENSMITDIELGYKLEKFITTVDSNNKNIFEKYTNLNKFSINSLTNIFESLKKKYNVRKNNALFNHIQNQKIEEKFINLTTFLEKNEYKFITVNGKEIIGFNKFNINIINLFIFKFLEINMDFVEIIKDNYLKDQNNNEQKLLLKEIQKHNKFINNFRDILQNLDKKYTIEQIKILIKNYNNFENLLTKLHTFMSKEFSFKSDKKINLYKNFNGENIKIKKKNNNLPYTKDPLLSKFFENFNKIQDLHYEKFIKINNETITNEFSANNIVFENKFSDFDSTEMKKIDSFYVFFGYFNYQLLKKNNIRNLDDDLNDKGLKGDFENHLNKMINLLDGNDKDKFYKSLYHLMKLYFILFDVFVNKGKTANDFKTFFLYTNLDREIEHIKSNIESDPPENQKWNIDLGFKFVNILNNEINQKITFYLKELKDI